MMDMRLTTHRDVSTAMARYDDRQLAELLEREAVPLGTGIGGASARLEVSGTSVFVKRVPLTEPELRRTRRPTCSSCHLSASTGSARPASAPGASWPRTR
jgi:hypothetical protein